MCQKIIFIDEINFTLSLNCIHEKCENLFKKLNQLQKIKYKNANII
jgi:hypothetical protein